MRTSLPTALLCAHTLFAAGPARSARPSILRVGLDPRSIPAAFVPGLDYSDEDERRPPAVTEAQLAGIQGLEIDVMNALARRVGMTPRIVSTDWFDLEAGLVEGRYDAILSSWTPTSRTPAEIVASIPYYEWGLLIAVRADDRTIRTVADLAERKVGHIPDPAVEDALSAMGVGLGARFVTTRYSGEFLFDDLRSGDIDALIFDSLFVRWRVAREGGAFRIVGGPLNRLGYHVGLRRSDADLLRRINTAIRGLLPSQEMWAIRKKWDAGP